MSKRKPATIIAILSITFAIWGCGAGEITTPEIPSGFAARTDSTVYTLRRVPSGYDAYARAVYVNRTGSVVHFARCDHRSTGPMYGLRRLVPDTGFHFVGGVWACVGGIPTGTLPANDSLVVSVWLGSTASPFAQPPITMSQRTGKFQIILALCDKAEMDSDQCKRVADEKRSSNPFDLNPPRE